MNGARLKCPQNLTILVNLVPDLVVASPVCSKGLELHDLWDPFQHKPFYDYDNPRKSLIFQPLIEFESLLAKPAGCLTKLSACLRLYSPS